MVKWWPLVFLIIPIFAYAKDPDGLYNNSPHKKWFTEQHNEQGQWCCDQSDGHPYLDDYTMNQDGSVTLANGDKIESFKILKGANPTGHAVAWFLDTDGGRTYYCFAPGTLG